MAKKSNSDQPTNTNRIVAHAKPGETSSEVIARTVISPDVQAALTVKKFSGDFGELDSSALADALANQISMIGKGDLGRAEAMLSSQAHSLDLIFHTMARRSLEMDYIDNFERFMKLALRAQAQSRATWEALSAIKNPPAVGYVRQANIAHGPQQVNNGAAGCSEDSASAEKNQNVKNKLLGEDNGERLDTRASSTAGGTDQEMAPVGAIHRAKNDSR
jgi:hypothetical protein